MKKVFLLLSSSILLVFYANTQDFLSTDNQWNVSLWSFGISTEIFKIEGDSTYNNQEYLKFWASYDSLNNWGFQGLVREEDNIIYYKSPESTEGILYNFNLGTGDSAYIKNYFCWDDQDIPIYIYATDSVEYYGVWRKRWHISDEHMNEETWIEGIGSINGPLYSNFWCTIICPEWDLLCFYNQDNQLFGGEDCYQTSVGVEDAKNDKTTISPNPVKSGYHIGIDSDENITSFEIYNANGKLIKSNSKLSIKNMRIKTASFSPGLYFLKINHIKTYKLLIN